MKSIQGKKVEKKAVLLRDFIDQERRGLIGDNMKNSPWEDIDLIDINNFIDDVALENANDPYSYWNNQDYR